VERHERFGSADRVIRVGFWANAGLMTMKLLAGYFGRSEAVFADGMESAADFIAILSSMVALRIGRQPYDEQHPYGHGRAENIAAIIVALVIFGTGGWILYRSVHAIIDGTYGVPQGIAVAAAFVTIIAKEALYRYTDRIGKHLGSPAILAAAKDHRKDAVTSVSTLIGVTGAFFGIAILDPIAAGLTSFFIFHIGYETFIGAAHDIMD
jgi:cation diffusion facilitator family transporter